MATNKLQWKSINMGEILPCQSFLRKKDGEILKLSTLGGVKVGQDCYYLPVDDVIEEIKNYPIEESEDERIRGNIIATIHLYYGEPLEDEAEKMIAWLEKQGEQKSIEYPLCKTVKDKIDYYIVNHFTTDTVVKTDVNSIVKAMKEGVMIGMSEQKPAEWSEKDSSLCIQIQGILSVCRCYNLLSPDLYKKMCDWLKSLRPQNWTKEDKKRYKSCLQRLSTGNLEQPETINSKWFKEHVYPQATWKPSDEQLKALKEAVDEHFDIDGGALWHLYEDLKKLREE